MKTRTISGIIMLAIVAPLLFIGGIYFKILIILLSLLGLYELLKVRKKYPLIINLLSYLYIILIVLSNINNNIYEFNTNLFFSSFIILLIPTLIYQKDKKYTISDAFYLIGGIFILGIFFSLLCFIRNINLYLLIYLIIIALFTDVFAYLIGTFFGKHKLSSYISPKKTIEGSIGGMIFAIFFGTLFYSLVIDSNANIYFIQLMSLILSIMGQLGDLVFSAIKREYNIKDFSNIIKGHGGILDRVDSLVFIVISYALIFIL